MSTKNMNVEIFEILFKTAQILKIVESSYKKIEEKITGSKTGSFLVSFSILFKSNDGKRELSITLTDYAINKRVFLNIYNREKGSFSPLSLDRFLKEICKDENTHKLMTFHATSIQEIEEKLILLFQSLEADHLIKITKILNGEDWIEMPFDWHGYK